jgi:hypothetical protein
MFRSGASAGVGPPARRCRLRPPRVRRRRSTGQTAPTGGRALGWGRCTALARSCAGAGTASGGSPPAWTGPTRWRGWCGSSRTSAVCLWWCAWTTWERWWPAPIPGWCCTRQRGSSPPPTGSRSPAAGRGMQPERARSSGRSGS